MLNGHFLSVIATRIKFLFFGFLRKINAKEYDVYKFGLFRRNALYERICICKNSCVLFAQYIFVNKFLEQIKYRKWFTNSIL
ncbi:unnamed protein product [Acanthoscelides obtectus]|uniref:Uncharacterized protein n=1 Tax=Acanthoscelides obtectus TaxID=200917 RepID=A0A9P0LWV9_ACAOB|nr:unnamed protein product [Acanthoscelides obtectus]CAK1624014.1 hypothetical protein AOBTE_LOCUS2281 [Acanthoscelides obtectus]